MDMLIETTRVEPWNLNKDVRYTDTTIAEQERGISIISTPISLILPDSRGKSHLMNFIDTPGHISLSGEITASRYWLLVFLFSTSIVVYFHVFPPVLFLFLIYSWSIPFPNH